MRSILEQEDALKNNLNSKNGMYVTFKIDSETYGIDVNRVQEIIGIVPISHIPNSPDYLMGVINLRGRVVPVLDVRIKFKMDTKNYDASTVILIVEFKDTSTGLIVDSVSDVIDIPADSIHDYSGTDSKIKSGSINYIASFNDDLILILDLDKMIDEEEILNAGNDQQ
ncbi:MAG TPA: chemotaxis protein CheW [Spirochaetota bacterium]|jgi:purine-binding chemotaxis protein CheW|nr:chemotaxis protein CheW [Spirochaetota bacterium]HPS87885.1 chemotaxis protein CheW [Spirochaetota bacterium]